MHFFVANVGSIICFSSEVCDFEPSMNFYANLSKIINPYRAEYLEKALIFFLISWHSFYAELVQEAEILPYRGRQGNTWINLNPSMDK